jgi:ATP synthase protein I
MSRASRATRAPTRLSPLGLTVRAGLAGVAMTAPIALTLSGVFGGVRGLISSAVGLALVALFFLVSMVLVERANSVGPALTLPVALTVYGIKIVVLGVIVFGTDAVSHLNAPAFCWSVVGATMGWLFAHATAVWRTKMPYVVIPVIPEVPEMETLSEASPARAGQRSDDPSAP